MLASVLSFAAHEQSIACGGTLLLAYGLGVGVPILVLATAAGSLARRFDRFAGTDGRRDRRRTARKRVRPLL